MDYEIANQISAEEYNEMRKIVGWQALSNEQAADGLKRASHLCCFRKDGKTIAFCRVLWDHLQREKKTFTKSSDSFRVQTKVSVAECASG